jgi:hypothetical protein
MTKTCCQTTPSPFILLGRTLVLKEDKVMWKIDRGTQNGVSTESYAPALEWKAQDLGAKTMLLRNNAGANSLKYRLLGYAAEGGIAHELVAETTLLAGETAEFHYDRQWHNLTLLVKDGSGHATFTLDYEGQGA